MIAYVWPAASSLSISLLLAFCACRRGATVSTVELSLSICPHCFVPLLVFEILLVGVGARPGSWEEAERN